jgi:hypothetical protein
MMCKLTRIRKLLWESFVSLLLIIFILATNSEAKNVQIPAISHEPCKIQSITYEGWPAQQLSNQWLTMTIVPQLGGRVII